MARLRTDAAHLDHDLPMPANNPHLDDVQHLVLQRRALLGSSEARRTLLGDGVGAPSVGEPTDPRSPFVVLGGATDAGEEDGAAARTADWLRPALDGLPTETTVWVTPLVRALLAAKLPAAVPRLRTAADSGSERGDALALWTAVLEAGHHPEGIRVVALPGTPADQLAIARALGARIGRIETSESTTSTRSS